MDIPCICPLVEGKPRHATDSVTLRERLGFTDAWTLSSEVQSLKSEDPDASTAMILAAMAQTYVLVGIESWSVVGVDGKPVEPTKPAIRELLLPNLESAFAVAEAAQERYIEVVLPLVLRAFSYSPDMPMDDSTPPTSSSPESDQNQFSPSSTTTTQTDVTEMTSLSLVGVSSSSEN